MRHHRHWPSPSPSNRRRVALAIAAAALAAGCAASPSAQTTLDDRLGGGPTVTTVVDRTIDRASTDPRTLRSVDGVKLKALKESLAMQVCAIAISWNAQRADPSSWDEVARHGTVGAARKTLTFAAATSAQGDAGH